MLGGKITGRLRTRGFVLRRWMQFVGTVVEHENDRVVIESVKRVEILLKPGELLPFDLRLGDRIGVTLGDDDELYIQRIQPIRNILRSHNGSINNPTIG